MFEIKNRSGAVIYTSATAENLRAALLEAISADANLAGADLARADLADADLADANLADANLADANLAGADLAGADLARADLAGADLARADLARANLADANLADANLADANLADANLADAEKVDPSEPYKREAPTKEVLEQRAERFRKRNPGVPLVEDLDRKMLATVTNGAGKLDMSQWHTCETTHCRAGWAIVLAGDPGRELESQYGPFLAGGMIYRASTGRAPHFFASTERALEDIRRCAGDES